MKKKDYYISQATIAINENNEIVDDEVIARLNGDTVYVDRMHVNYIDVAPSQVVSITTSCIPFLEYDDANRTLMGANMQRQAVPLLETEAPIVVLVLNILQLVILVQQLFVKQNGVVEYADALKIVVKVAKGTDTYNLANFERSNASSGINHHPLVKAGD